MLPIKKIKITLSNIDMLNKQKGKKMRGLIAITNAGQGYHLGLIKSGETVILQAVREKDFLDCELWQYLGHRLVTKKFLKEKKLDLLAAINKQFGTNFTKIKID